MPQERILFLKFLDHRNCNIPVLSQALAPSSMAASLTPSSGTAIIFPRIIKVVVPCKENISTGHSHKSRSFQKQDIISEVFVKKTNDRVDDSIRRIVQL